eukprot:CAMPEP_0116874604 /NCGR_PEP_ID=MMETSP0463-20121206/6089_1 /TAXON_ID=181622 /ORGANISM="Strombidinopsis sp, Strain SopsisLIS2011" /LENGTH=111 /DNA_ID=CAMNT_0004518461 /DNA_START=117 /DNA_END=452 /DNA_ORIENTATION=+
MKALFTSFGFEIRDLVDADRSDVKKAIYGLQFELEDLKKEDKKALIVMYFSGHGMMDDQSLIVLNEDGEDFELGYVDYLFPMERKLRTIASLKRVFVVGIFDCCRSLVRKT